MKKPVLLILLYILGVGFTAAAASGQLAPGYMDADYYFAGGIQLATGNGFTEPFLWNYLDNPSGVPHPSHLYWMPLASIIAGGGMAISGSVDFLAARWPFILLSGLLPVLSACLAMNLLSNKRYAWIAGLLGLFPGIYVIYLSIPETFVLYIVLGGLFTLTILRDDWVEISSATLVRKAGLLGGIAGLMHLSRADGIIWFAGGLLWLVWVNIKKQEPKKYRIAIFSMGLFFLAYLLIMGAWYARNLELFGMLFPAGNNRALWLTDYNQTFSFPADNVNFSSWWAAGWGAHFEAWGTALKMNIKNLVGVNGLVVLLPLQASGIWVNRTKPGVLFTLVMLSATFVLMTFVFPYSGARGGYIHSASAFQPFLWAAAVAGLEVFVKWGERKRDWHPEKAIPRFGVLLAVVCALITGWFYITKVFAIDSNSHRWGYSYKAFEEIVNDLEPFGSQMDTLYMVNNPPGFFIATGKSSIVIPGGEIQELLSAAERYGVKYLIVESGQANLTDLFENPGDRDSLQFLKTISDTQLFCFKCR